jgi:hypothetical protein
LNEQGFEQQGVLIKSVFTAFKRIRKQAQHQSSAEGGSHV